MPPCAFTRTVFTIQSSVFSSADHSKSDVSRGDSFCRRRDPLSKRVLARHQNLADRQELQLGVRREIVQLPGLERDDLGAALIHVQLAGVEHFNRQRKRRGPVIKRSAAPGLGHVLTHVQNAGDFAGRMTVARKPDEDGGIGRTHGRRERSNRLHRDRPWRGQRHHRHGFTEAVTQHIEIRRAAQDEPERPALLPHEPRDKMRSRECGADAPATAAAARYCAGRRTTANASRFVARGRQETRSPSNHRRNSASAPATATGFVDCGVRRAATAASGVITLKMPSSNSS